MSNSGCATWFDWFATNEAAGSSKRYERLARGIAADAEMCALIDALPMAKRQPNLLFATARFLGAPTAEWNSFRDFVHERWGSVADVMRERSTQTNEASRCGVLLPLLAQLPQPLALIEIGASAGLCLFPDRYQYDFDGAIVGPPSPVRLAVRTEGSVPIPQQLPKVAWRRGLDLHPLDVTDDDDVAWLRSCIWPEHDERRRRLDAAVELARVDPPEITAGDLATDLEPLLATAPKDATTVVFHSAVLSYCSHEQRAGLRSLLSERPQVVWISNEAPGVVDGIATGLQLPGFASSELAFIVGRNGTDVVALSDPHGGWVAWDG